MSIYVGQCGVEKSGNYLLFRIIKSLLSDIDSYQSYSNITGCWDSLIKMNDTDLSFTELESMDEFRVDDDQTLYHLNSHFKASFSIWDIKNYENKATFLWTHQPPNNSHFTVLNKPRHWFYIIRDGRAVINSWLHYTVSPRMLRRHPQYKINNVEELYSNIAYFEKCIHRWSNHVYRYLKLKNSYTLVSFEDMITDKIKIIDRIADKLNIVDRNMIQNAFDRTQIKITKREAPLHVRKGVKNDWVKYFKEEHINLYQDITKDLLDKINIESYKEW